MSSATLLHAIASNVTHIKIFLLALTLCKPYFSHLTLMPKSHWRLLEQGVVGLVTL